MADNIWITAGLPVALFIIMVGMGLSLTPADFRRVAAQPRILAAGLVLQWLLVPLLGFGVGFICGGGITAAGIVLVAALPGGTTSNVLTYLSRGNLALSISLTLVASLTAVATLPLWANLGLQWFADDTTELTVPFASTLAMLLVIVVIPVAIGMVVRAKAVVLAGKLERYIGVFSVGVLVAIIVAILATSRGDVGPWLASAWLPVLMLNVFALAVGLLVGRLMGANLADGMTLAIESGIKNTALALTIALTVVGNTELAIPAAVYGLMMYASVAVLAFIGRRYLPPPAAIEPK